MPPEQVPSIQRRIVCACRQAGKPLDRRDADAGIDDPGADADPRGGVRRGIRRLSRRRRGDVVEISLRTVSLEAVPMMDGIVATENDRAYCRPARLAPVTTIPDAISASMRQITSMLPGRRDRHLLEAPDCPRDPGQPRQ